MNANNLSEEVSSNQTEWEGMIIYSFDNDSEEVRYCSFENCSVSEQKIKITETKTYKYHQQDYGINRTLKNFTKFNKTEIEQLEGYWRNETNKIQESLDSKREPYEKEGELNLINIILLPIVGIQLILVLVIIYITREKNNGNKKLR